MTAIALQDISYDSRPSVLVIAHEPRAEEIAAVLEQIGARPAQLVRPDATALERAGDGAYDAAYCALDSGVDPVFADMLLSRLDSAASVAGIASVVEIGRADIDRTMAIAGHPDVVLLCEPASGERIAALAMALRPRTARLNDVSNDVGSTRLVRLSEEISRIARTLATIAEAGAPHELGASGLCATGFDGASVPAESVFLDEDVSLGRRIREIIRARRGRDLFFSPELFGDPAWDMLLDLMAARCERQKVAVSSLCIAAAVPATTALRWLKMMTSSGLVVRNADVTDGRRVFIDLSEDSARALRAYLSQFGGIMAA